VCRIAAPIGARRFDVAKRRKKHVPTQAPVRARTEVPRSDQGLERPEEFALELNVKSRAPQAPTVEVGWCLLPGTVEYLHKQGVIDPYILLIAIDERGQEMRELHQVRKGMTFWTFTRPGKVTLHAMIVFSSIGEGRPLQFLTRHGNGYDVTIFLHDQELRNLNRDGIFGHSEVELVLDEKCFAKEPPAWLKRWVNLAHRGRAEDECHFRKRAIFAFTIQPWAALVYYTVKVITMVCLGLWHVVVLGNTKVNFLAIWPIIGVEWTATAPYNKTSFWLHPWRWQISPIALVAYAFIATVLSGVTGSSPAADLPRLIGIGIVCGYVLILLVYCSVAYEAWQIKNPKYADAGKRLREAEARRAEQARRMQEELDYLVCRGGIPRAVSVSSLPRERRTLDLRFAALKAKLCRQFAR